MNIDAVESHIQQLHPDHCREISSKAVLAFIAFFFPKCPQTHKALSLSSSLSSHVQSCVPPIVLRHGRRQYLVSPASSTSKMSHILCTFFSSVFPTAATPNFSFPLLNFTGLFGGCEPHVNFAIKVVKSPPHLGSSPI
jgi:hypothetical protein